MAAPAPVEGICPVLIGELSRLTGVSARMLRYYEEKGLLRPDRRPNGYRLYHQTDVDRVRCLREMFDSGLSAQMIANNPLRINQLDQPQVAPALVSAG